jgi:hypothetical protein
MCLVLALLSTLTLKGNDRNLSIAVTLSCAAVSALAITDEAKRQSTKKAIAELEAGKGKKFASVDDLMADLKAED